LNKWILAALLLIFSLSVQAAGKQATEAQIKALKSNISKLQKSIRTESGEQRKLEKAQRESAAKLNQLAQQKGKLDVELAGLNSHAGSLRSQRDQLRKKLSAGELQIQQLIRQQHRLGEQSRLQLLLSQKDPEQVNRMLHYYDDLNAALAKQLAEFQQQLQALKATEDNLGGTELDIAENKSQLDKQIALLKKAREQRREKIAAIKKSISHQRKKIGDYQKDQKRLQKVLAGIIKSIEQAKLAQRNQKFSKQKGKLDWPIRGRVLRSFGSKQNSVSYTGIFIRAAAGQSVRAVHGGRVVYSDWLRGYGQLLIIDHGDGYMSLYGHNEGLLKQTGDRVAVGEIVTTVGQTSDDGEPGLYFGIRYNGKSSNPRRWLKK